MKTFKEIDIKYYDNSGNVQVRCTVPVTQEALVHYELMRSHYCNLSFKLSRPTYFLLGDFIETPYGRFELIDLTKAKDNDTIGYSYEIQFDAYYRKLKNKILKYRPNTGSQEATFSLTSKISTHIEVIMKNLAYYAKLDKSYLYDPNFEGEGTDYTYVIDASVDANAAKLITYSNSSILDAIANIAQTFGCEWWFEGNILHFGTCENTNAITDFRLNDNIVSMSSSQSQSTYANRVYAFGAARNLPSGYKNDSDADITKDGVVEKRLMLPTSAECSEQNKQMLAENGFELKNGYIQVGGLREDQYVEGVTTNDDIYPRNLIKTSKVTSYEKDVEDESTPEEGDYIKRTFYRVNSLTIVNEDGEKTGDMAFRKAYILSGKNLHIVFQSGSLNGMDFECEFNPDGVPEILLDDDGNPIFKDGKEQINPKSQVFEIVANEDYGRFLPDTTLHPKDGDTFVLYNWNSTKLGDALVPSASNELLADAIKNLKKSVIDPTTYTCTAEDNYSYNHGRGNLHGVGDRVNLYNKGYGDGYRSSRVIGYEFSLDIPFDGAKYYVGEKPSYSRLNAMESKIEELIYNGQSYLNGNGGSGRSIYIIKSYDSITPTDYNVFSAKAVDEQRLNKTKDDTAKGTITWEKVQKLLSGLLVGNSNSENGGSWTPDTEGRSHLITDYLEVRMKAIFEELVVKKTSTIGGKEIISPAGGVVAHKVEEVTVTYNNVSQKAYRCYFLAEQEGDAVDNDFAIGDQVRSESFNVRKGTYHKVGNHFYWRLIIGRNEDPVELEGKKYHYIDLSDTDCATASDVPAKGDVLSQCGNRTDVERQNCLIFSAVDTYSPSVSLYHGINSYSFANKEYVEYGVNKQTNKAFYNVYGDMYVGDRPTKENGYEGSSYIKYDSAAKQVSIKGKLSAKSTVDGKELSQYIKENSAKGLTEEQVNNLIKNSQVITDLQNQVDGAIETWFYEGVPTLKNAPASSWTTDKDKDTHLGDLYYDNKTGKAYRFAKDGNTYKWTIITDTDIAKALSDASKAQETADGKMKVFSTQPIPPYQLGDIWVNATYPTDGSIYKNEVLRCQTNKAAGSQFAIADWIKASKYTDDTVANAAKAAAEKAQKAAETAQTNITNLGKTVTTNKKAFDNYVNDGYLEPSEIAAMAQDSKRLEDDFAAAQKSYNEVKDAEVLKDTKELTDLNTAFVTLSTAKTELVTYLSDISARYNAANTEKKATIVSAVGTKFTNFQSAYSAFYDKLGLANAYITSKIYGDLGVVIGDVATYQYLKKVLADGVETEINGGLILTSLIALRDPETKRVESGINGVIDKTAKGNGIATWWGGYMNDGEVVGFDKKEDYSKQAATSLVRFDGSGYLANGAIWWGTDGKVHADPTSFIISEKNLGAYLTFFEPTWKSGSAGTSVADLVSLKPNAPFTKLGVSGDATFEGAITFHGIKLTYDATNKAIKIDGNLYATGGITAYGAASSGAGGGGLNASVISYARIIEGSYTDADLTSIPNAYAIKALSSRIDNIATELGGLNLSWNNITGKPSTFAPSAHKHKWVDITDRITKVSQLTNDAGYLTAHQSLASYYTKAEIDAKGYTTNKGTVTSVALTLPTGLTCATKTITTSGTFAISLASGYSIPTTTKQTAWDGAVSAKHTHSNKSVLDGISSTKVSHWDSAYDWYALMTTDEETADGIINKWNEVVNFLANIAQTDTLSGIVDGINKSISDEVTRAKKAEGVNASGISTNKTNITTLQGYFTSGSAKKALQLTNARKLWGNSFNGTADINGSIIVPSGKYISIGNIKMEYDATNKALKITNTTTNEVANLYATGGITAYGEGSGSSGGGGLNGSVKSYADALKLTSESLSEIASAYSIKALDSRISSLEGGSATAISVSGSGNAVTSVTKNGTTISVVKGSTFLTSHQSLDGYVNNITTSGTGNAITSVTKSGKTVTFTKGATFLTSHQSLSAYLKSADAANTYLKLSGGAMTGNISYKGSKNTYEMIKFVDNNADIYGNGICIGGGGLTIIGGGESVSEVLKQHTNGGDENMIVANDAAIDFFSNMNSGWDSRKAGSFDTSGYWNGVGFKKNNSNDNYVLTGGGGHKAISNLSVRYASSAGSATKLQNSRTINGTSFNGTANIVTSYWGTTRKLWGNSVNGNADVNGSITIANTDGVYVQIGDVRLVYDKANTAIKVVKSDGTTAANFYATGGITAYGEGSGSSGGGGLNASVISYARIIEGSYTDADLTSIPNAYAIKALSSRIDNIATELGGLNLSWNNITGKPSTFAPSAHKHKWVDITDRITKVSQLTNDAGYLTAHQSLASYYTKAEIDAKGYTTNKGTVTSVALTLPTGLTCATKTITTSGTFAISLASGYSIPTTTKQTAWDGAVSAKHTHSNKSVLDGISSTKVSHWDSAYDWYALMTTDEETADGIINKWNEVVNFLANIAQTDTLSGIVDGINKSISDEVTRAKKAEGVNASGISTNKTNITTLQGYFTSGSAKKALQLTNARKLWGNSFNGTADINGSIIVPSGKYISIGNIKMEYDATNKALKITNTTTNEVANLYATGGITAYGEGSGSSGGGGLNGSVKSYADALKLTSESLSEIASAYSIKALDSRISSLEGGSATAISVSGSGNAVTSVTKNGTTISVVKGSTFLTSHQSLDGYVNNITTSGTGNAITSVTKSGKTVTFTKGATFLTSHQSLNNYVTKGSVLKDNVNLDSITTTGFYRASGLKTLPGYGQLLTIFAGGDTITQIYGAFDGRLYTRGGNPTDVGGHGYWSNWKIIAYVGDNISVFTNDKGYLTSHQDISGKADKSQLTNYLPLSGGKMSGVLQLNTPSTGMTEPNTMRLFLNTDKYDGINSTPGIGFHILNTCWGNLRMESDTSLSWFNYNNSGYYPIKAKGFIIGDNASDSYVLLGGGGHKAISSLSVNYANSAGSANSVAWSNVSARPTKVSQFTNDSGYITSSGSCSYASSAGNADTVDGYHHTSFLKLAGGTMTGRLNFTPSISATGKYDEGMMWFGSISHDLATNYYYYIPWFGGHDVVNNYGYGNTISVGAYHQQTSDCGLYIGMSWDGNAPDNFFRFSRSGNFLAPGGITAYSSSDIRLKQDLRKLDYLGIIKAMGGTFGFAWKKDNTRSIGWIAQHVLCNPHLKDIVETDENGYYKINYWSPKLIATAFGAIEQVGDEVSRLKARVVFLESEVQRLSGKQDGNNKKRLDNKNINLLN